MYATCTTDIFAGIACGRLCVCNNLVSMTDEMARLIFFALGLLGFIADLQLWLLWQKSRHWPRAKGEILESAVTGSDGDDYCLEVKYRYTVKGHEYRRNRLRFGETNGKINDSRAPAKAKQYAPGASVRVIYDPDNPSFSALEKPSLFSAILLMAVSLLVYGFFSFWFPHFQLEQGGIA